MKKIIFVSIAMATISFTACNNNADKKAETTTEQPTATNEQFACSMHPEVIGNKADKCSKCGMELSVPVIKKTETANPNDTTQSTLKKDTTKQAASKADVKTTDAVVVGSPVKEIVSNYLFLKNALSKDDAKTAASAAFRLQASFKRMGSTSIDATLKQKYLDIAETAAEHAEHIAANGAKIDHQREHFASLSKDINDIIALFGSPQKLYQDFCPMYDNGKGAYWISEVKEIKNPYFGSQMLTCGSVKKQY
jgi:hypothetical protein